MQMGHPLRFWNYILCALRARFKNGRKSGVSAIFSLTDGVICRFNP